MLDFAVLLLTQMSEFAGRGDGQRVLVGQVMSISGTPERRMD
jgi:hypothetical protein